MFGIKGFPQSPLSKLNATRLNLPRILELHLRLEHLRNPLSIHNQMETIGLPAYPGNPKNLEFVTPNTKYGPNMAQNTKNLNSTLVNSPLTKLF
jgi:hypothetical protein